MLSDIAVTVNRLFDSPLHLLTSSHLLPSATTQTCMLDIPHLDSSFFSFLFPFLFLFLFLPPPSPLIPLPLHSPFAPLAQHTAVARSPSHPPLPTPRTAQACRFPSPLDELPAAESHRRQQCCCRFQGVLRLVGVLFYSVCLAPILLLYVGRYGVCTPTSSPPSRSRYNRQRSHSWLHYTVLQQHELPPPLTAAV